MPPSHPASKHLLTSSPEEVEPRKRLFLRTSLAGLTSVALASCGGGDGDDGAAIDPIAPEESEIELVQELIPLEPLPSQFDLTVDPLTLVQGDTQVHVIQDGAPVVGAALQLLGADGRLYASGHTDAEGLFSWQGARSFGVRVVVQGRLGELSHYEVDDPAYSLRPLVVNVATTLADRVRLARQWLPSQAEQRAHEFLWISRDVPLSTTLIDSPEFSHARFAQARAASGLSQDDYLNHLVSLAIADDYAAHSIDFAPPQPAQEQARVLPFGMVAWDVITTLTGFARQVLDQNLSDEQKQNLFGGLLLSMGVLKDDPVLKQLERMDTKLDDLQATMDKAIKEIRDVKAKIYSTDIHKLDKALSEIHWVRASGLNDSNKREEILKIIVRDGIADSPPLPLKMLRDFLGGFGTQYAQLKDAAYPMLFLQLNDIDITTGKLEQGKQDPIKFFGRERARLYGQALLNVRALFSAGMALATQYQCVQLARIDQASDSTAHANAMNRLEVLADDTVTYNKLLDDLQRYQELPHEYVYLNLEDNAAWFNDRWHIAESTRFYGGWHGDWSEWSNGRATKPWTKKYPDKTTPVANDLRNADRWLPREVRSMARHRWHEPSQAQFDSTFFKPAGSKSVHDYATAHGAPSNGVYAINEKGKPAFHIWLSDLQNVSRARLLLTWVKHNYERSFAKMHDKKFATVHGICSRLQEYDLARGINAGPMDQCEYYGGTVPQTKLLYSNNYNQDTAYYYPTCTDVVQPEQYYPWHHYLEAAKKTKNFDPAHVYYVYSERTDWHPKPRP